MINAADSSPVHVPGLRYVHDHMPGLTRRKRGKGFSYLDSEGQPVRDDDTLERIASLAVPPAYQQVWICADPRGHLQATGRDDLGRKQYRYHPKWQTFRNNAKFAGLVEFAKALPRLRRRVTEDLQRPTLDQTRVLAAAVRLMELTLIRAGHGGRTAGKPTYGLANLCSTHVALGRGGHIELAFRGKSGQMQQRAIASIRLAKTLRKCHGLPGRQLFQYIDDDGQRCSIDAADLNDYLREAMDIDATAKDFRTWGATVYAAAVLANAPLPESDADQKRQIVAAIKQTAAAIGNRPATCRKYYIAPAVLEAYVGGSLQKVMNDRPDPDRRVPRRGLGAEEKAVLKLLKKSSPSLAV